MLGLFAIINLTSIEIETSFFDGLSIMKMRNWIQRYIMLGDRLCELINLWSFCVVNFCALYFVRDLINGYQLSLRQTNRVL